MSDGMGIGRDGFRTLVCSILVIGKKRKKRNLLIRSIGMAIRSLSSLIG